MNPFLKQAARDVVVKHFPDYATDDKDRPRDFYVAFHSLEKASTARQAVGFTANFF